MKNSETQDEYFGSFKEKNGILSFLPNKRFFLLKSKWVT